MPKITKSREEVTKQILKYIKEMRDEGWSSREMAQVLSKSHTVISQVLKGTYPHAKLDE